MNQFHNHTTDDLYNFGRDLLREARGLTQDSRNALRNAGEYFLEAFNREGAEAFWLGVKAKGLVEREIKRALRKTGWSDPAPAQAPSNLSRLQRAFSTCYPRLSAEEREIFLALVAEAGERA